MEAKPRRSKRVSVTPASERLKVIANLRWNAGNRDRQFPGLIKLGAPLKRAITGDLKFQVRNVTRGTSIGDAIDSAASSAQRRTGLLKHDKLDQGAGLWIVPCEAVHTFFMKFAIDLIYLDRKHRVRGLVRELRPWRFSICLPAHSVLEVPLGTIDRTNTRKGDELELLQA
jgi:uncharacterized membrane protein (UPF0127 family)